MAYAALGIPGFYRLLGLYAWRCQVVLRLGDSPSLSRPLPDCDFLYRNLPDCAVVCAQTGSGRDKCVQVIIDSTIMEGD